MLGFTRYAAIDFVFQASRVEPDNGSPPFHQIFNFGKPLEAASTRGFGAASENQFQFFSSWKLTYQCIPLQNGLFFD